MADSYKAKFSDITLATTRIRNSTKSLISKEDKVRKEVANLEQHRDTLQQTLFHHKKDQMTLQKAVDHELVAIARQKDAIFRTKTTLQGIVQENKTLHGKQRAIQQALQEQLEAKVFRTFSTWKKMHQKELSKLVTPVMLEQVLASSLLEGDARDTLAQVTQALLQEEQALHEETWKADKIRQDVLALRRAVLERHPTTTFDELQALERAWACPVTSGEAVEAQLFYGASQ